MSLAYESLLDDTRVFLDSEPGCRAINTVKQIDNSLTLTFARALAQARYIDGIDNTLLSTFLAVAEKLDIDTVKFRKMYESQEMKKLTEETFIRAGEYAHSYPSMFLQIYEETATPISLMNYEYLRLK